MPECGNCLRCNDCDPDITTVFQVIMMLAGLPNNLPLREERYVIQDALQIAQFLGISLDDVWCGYVGVSSPCMECDFCNYAFGDGTPVCEHRFRNPRECGVTLCRDCGVAVYRCGDCDDCGGATTGCGDCGDCADCVETSDFSSTLTADDLEAIRESGEVIRIELDCGRIVTIDPDTITNISGSIDLNVNIDIVDIDEWDALDVPLESLVIQPAHHGNFGFSVSYTITKAELTAAGIEVDEDVDLFYVDADGHIVDGVGTLIVNSNGSVTVTINSASKYVVTKPRLGIFSSKNRTPAVADALAILRNLVGLSSALDNNAIAKRSAKINNPKADAHAVADALSILRHLVGLSSPLERIYKR
jgi:hypothetical protein